MNEEALDAPAEEAERASEATPARPRRRRRGSRGRSRSGSATKNGSTSDTPAPAQAEAEAPPSGDGASPEAGAGGSRKRGGRRRGGGRSSTQAREAASEDAPPTDGQEEDGRKKAGAESRRKRPSRRAKAAGGDGAAEAAPKAEASSEASSEEALARRRRRRRRGRRGAAEAPEAEAAPGEKPAEKPGEKPASRARRRRSGTATAATPAAAEGTRTRARGKRRTPGRRRREAEVRAPRRTDKTMVISERGDRDQIAVLEGRELVEHYITRVGATSMVGNIYLGRVQNVLPGMEAAFVDVGRGRNAVLYSGEVSYDEELDGEQPPIEQVLKPGQSVMVQVTKDPMGGKGARLTGQVSLPGRYVVYVPDGSASGISRRLPDEERARLRAILKKVQPKNGSVIVRTAAEGASEEELAADLARLRKTWDSIKRKARRGRAPKLLYEEPELTVRVVRDVFSPAEFERIVTDSKAVYEKVVAYLEDVAPDLVERVELYEGRLPLFEEYHVAEQIRKALERKVWLPSGGYLVVDRTEAMTIIDVNTGKHVGKSNLEETVAQTNVEAAKEIARQLRLRDIGGIIVIDFIDMLLQRNRDLVVDTLKQALAQDRTRSQVFDITPLGLLEMTRKRVSAGLVESFSETCPTCEGRGILLTHEV